MRSHDLSRRGLLQIATFLGLSSLGAAQVGCLDPRRVQLEEELIVTLPLAELEPLILEYLSAHPNPNTALEALATVGERALAQRSDLTGSEVNAELLTRLDPPLTAARESAPEERGVAFQRAVDVQIRREFDDLVISEVSGWWLSALEETLCCVAYLIMVKPNHSTRSALSQSG